MPHAKSLWNEYAAQLAGDGGAAGGIIDKIPKMVALAVAVSALTSGGDRLHEARDSFLREWWCLYDNKIVPQKPPYPRPTSEPDEESMHGMGAGV